MKLRLFSLFSFQFTPNTWEQVHWVVDVVRTAAASLWADGCVSASVPLRQ